MTRIESWQRRAAALAAHLADSGALTSPEWRAAFAEVPRHVFTPAVLDGDRVVSAADPSWLDTVYSDDALLTQTASASDAQQLPTSSSSSKPTIMAVMLELLAAQPGMRVLEIGTGTGYNAALMCHHLGDRNVTTVDIDPGLVTSARDRLAELGYYPTLGAGDGAKGWADAGLFDRILATCAVRSIPPAWIGQLAPAGRIVAPLAGHVGPLMVLDKTAPDEVTGRFDPHPADFMPLRPSPTNPLADGETTAFTATGMPHHGTTNLDPTYLLNASSALLLFCQLHAPGLRMTMATVHRGSGASLITYTNAALAEVPIDSLPQGGWLALQRGTHRLWDILETAVRTWHEQDEPGHARLGITALDDADRQYVWLDDPDGTHSWPLT